MMCIGFWNVLSMNVNRSHEKCPTLLMRACVSEQRRIKWFSEFLFRIKEEKKIDTIFLCNNFLWVCEIDIFNWHLYATTTVVVDKSFFFISTLLNPLVSFAHTTYTTCTKQRIPINQRFTNQSVRHYLTTFANVVVSKAIYINRNITIIER